MEMSMSLHNSGTPARGFSMLETLVALFVLTTGLVSLASLSSKTMLQTAVSGYTSTASILASEKLEDLNRWPTWDPHVCVAAGGTSGSLTSDSQAASVTCNGITDTVDYYDDVTISTNTGAVCQTVSSIVAGAEQYTTSCHTPGGTMQVSTSPSATAQDVGTIAFHRRWTVEMDQPVTGLKRMTVLVTLANSFVNPGVSFQLSSVRP